jgi:hypothetical protein
MIAIHDVREERHMRTSAIIAITAAFAFAGGLWTGASLAVSKPTTHAATISPSALHLQVKPSELPAHDVEKYN